MPGISGKVTSGDRVIERPQELLDAFRRVHALQGIRFVEGDLTRPHCVLLCSGTGLLKTSADQPACDPASGIYLFLEGEVFNLEELRPQSNPPAAGSACEALLAMFLEQGTAFAPRLDGQFNIAIYESRENRLTVINDRLSSKPMYYLEEDGALLIGSEKKSILAIAQRSPRIDPVGLLQVFAYRHNLSGRTFIEGIRRLSAGSELQFHDGKLTVRRHERLHFHVMSPLKPVRRLAEEWGEALRTDMRRRLRGKSRVLISLSGGLDSRAFTCAVPRDFRPIWARTRGSDSSPDVVCAKEISRRLGIEHLQEDPQDVPYSAFAAKAVWRTECEVTFTHCFSIAAHEPIKRHGDFLFAGQSGEIVAGGHIYPYMLVPRSRRSFVERAYEWYLIYPERRLQGIFNPDFLRRTFPDLKEAFLASFDAYDGDSNVDAYQIWDLQERQARMTLSAGPVDSHLFEKVYALIGRTYTDYALKLPLRLRYGQTLYQCMILELGPELLDVPYANTGLRLRGSIPGNLWNKVHHLARKGTERVLQKLGLAKARSAPGAADEARRALREDPAFRRIITGFVESEHCDPGIFNRQGIQRLLEEEYSGARSHVSLLCLLGTFALGLPYFVYERPVACPAEAEPVPESLKRSGK